MVKKQFKIKCPNCDKEIIGFSQKHAEINLMIHKQTSQRHKEIVALLKKKGLQEV
jgi:phage FluMu protein Com